MINIFSRINKELASWIAMFQFLRGLDRYGPNLELGDDAKAIFDLALKHSKPRRRSGRHLKSLLLALCCVIAGNSETAALITYG